MAHTETHLASDLRVAVGRLARRLRSERELDGLGLSSASVLGRLSREGEQTVGELADAERVQPPSMTRTVGCLVDGGYVVRRQDAADRRRVLVSLTERGEAVLKAERRRRDAWLAQRLDELTADDRALLARAAPILERLSTV